jgi:NADH dehydrogenase FAD-containing subunit
LLLKYVKITLVEAGKSVLAVFDETLQREALKRLTQRDTQLVGAGLIAKEVTTVLLSAGVKEVGEKLITLSTGELLPYGFCVWAAGNGPIPLVLDVIENIPEQKALQGKARGRIVTDSWLRVAGADGVYSIGDCAMMEESPLPATAQVASQQGAYLGRLFSKGFDMKPNRVAAAVAAAAITAGADAGNGDGDSKAPAAAAAAVAASKVPSLLPPYRAAGDDNDDAVFASEYAGFGRLSYNADNTPIIKKRAADGTVQELEVVYAKPFQFLNLGVLAYVGASKALAQISVGEKNILGYGPLGFLLWRGIYWSKQVSWRNRVLVGLDWVKGRLFGRDIGNL